MKFGKLTHPDELGSIDFTMPPQAERSTVFLSERTPNQSFRAFVGLPMWGNKDWVGKLYHKKTKAGDFLGAYAKSFNGIELNSTHYRIPRHDMVARWRSMVPEGFKFSPKIPQVISHRYQLINCQGVVDEFCEAIKGFGEFLGCSFVQLAPGFSHAQLNKLEWFLLAAWPRELPLAVEFRHASWFDNHQLKPEVVDLLESTGVTAIITDVAGRRDVLHSHLSTSTAMIRFVGNGLVPTDYQRADAWVARIQTWVDLGLEELYFFVHEPDDAFAPEMGSYVIQQLNKVLGLQLKVPTIMSGDDAQMTLF